MAALIQFASGAPGIKYALDKPQISIGRHAGDNDICVPCSYVSKCHARLEALPDASGTAIEFYLYDLDSTNKTYVNDQPVTRIKLEHNDVIRIGRNTFKFDASGAEAMLEAVMLSAAPPPPQSGSDESRTWQFSRRLRLLGIDA